MNKIIYMYNMEEMFAHIKCQHVLDFVLIYTYVSIKDKREAKIHKIDSI